MSMIRERVHNGTYKTVDMFQMDLKRMFDNCRLYNKPATSYYKYGCLEILPCVAWCVK